MKSKVLKGLDILLILIQILASVYLIYKIHLLLPAKFLAIAVLTLLIIVLLVILMLIVKKKLVWFTRLVSLLLSICLILGSIITNKGLDTLDEITNNHEESTLYSVIVLVDSNDQEIADLEGQKVGICTLFEDDKFDEVLDNLTSQVEFEQVEEASINDLYEDLMSQEVDAIVLNEGFRSTIEEIDEDFSTETRNIYQYQLDTEIEEVKTETKLSVTKEPFNIFISGIDTYGPVSTRSRSDVNMIVTVNPTTKTIVMTSIPRDYYVTLASFGAKDKLTHAGLYGVNESIATLENLFGIDIQYYARVNFTSLTTMVDALGGITVYNPEAFTSWTDHSLYYPVGNIDMDGRTALLFARERYHLAGGDRSRVLNQQRVLQAMLQKAMSPAIIYNYNDVLNAIAGCFETNMSSEEIQSIIQMQLNDMSSWNFQSQSVDGTGTTSTTCYSYAGPALYVMEPDLNTVNACVANINAAMGK